jgi:hypothetical protein
MSTLYLFVDESGNFDFSPNGTKYFILTVLSTTDPHEIGSPLLKLRYDLLPNYACGTKMEERGYFHASEDAQNVRDDVFSIISRIGLALRVDSIIAQKNKADKKFYQNHKEFYEILAKPLLRYAFNRANWKGYAHVVVVFSSIFNNKIRSILKQTFKYLIKRYTQLSYSIYFHSSKFDLCSQAADYFGWAIYRKWESGDNRSHNLVRVYIKSELDIFKGGKTEFYAYKK